MASVLDSAAFIINLRRGRTSTVLSHEGQLQSQLSLSTALSNHRLQVTSVMSFNLPLSFLTPRLPEDGGGKSRSERLSELTACAHLIDIRVLDDRTGCTPGLG